MVAFSCCSFITISQYLQHETFHFMGLEMNKWHSCLSDFSLIFRLTTIGLRYCLNAYICKYFMFACMYVCTSVSRTLYLTFSVHSSTRLPCSTSPTISNCHFGLPQATQMAQNTRQSESLLKYFSAFCIIYELNSWRKHMQPKTLSHFKTKIGPSI